MAFICHTYLLTSVLMIFLGVTIGIIEFNTKGVYRAALVIPRSI